MSSSLLSLQDIHLTFGGSSLLQGAELSVAAGDRICLVGRNGSGKSSLLKIAAGALQPDRGTVFLHPGATVRYLAQEPDFTGFRTTHDYVAAGLGPGDDPYRAVSLLEALGLRGDENPVHLSGGEARRTAIAHVLAPQPDILLLDEPTNHLDLPAIEWLENELARMASALVLVSHDRRFLSTLSRKTVWLSQGVARVFESGFATFETIRDRILEEEQEATHKLERKLAREEDWLRHGVTARRKRNQGRLRALHDLRRQHHSKSGVREFGSLAVAESAASGQLVAEMNNISKSFDTVSVVSELTLRVARGDRIGIVGPNGAGKTTLLKLITGELAPDSGEIRLGSNLEIVWLDQKRSALDPSTTLADALTEGRGDMVSVDGRARHVIGYMKDFLFAPEQARTALSVLSGGERGRLMLARAFARRSNLLVLDEPTNDLDLETLDLLEDLICEYRGTVLLVSHDRDFLDRIATSIVAPDPLGPGRWREYSGGFTDMKKSIAPPSPSSVASSPKPKEKQAEAARAADKRKLSFKDKHALETLPATLAELSAIVATLRARLDDPTLYMRDRKAFEDCTDALRKAEQRHAAAEEEWLRIALLQEEIESER